MAKVAAPDILSKKERGEKTTRVTAYYPSARLVDELGLGLTLVSDVRALSSLAIKTPFS